MTGRRELISYPVPWDQVLGLTRYIARRERRDLADFTRSIVERMEPPPLIEGLQHLPDEPRLLLVANHYQRKGLWILHSAAAVEEGIELGGQPGHPVWDRRGGVLIQERPGQDA